MGTGIENAFDRVSAFVVCSYGFAMASLIAVLNTFLCLYTQYTRICTGRNTSAHQSDFCNLKKEKYYLGLILQSKSSRKLKRRLPCNYVTLIQRVKEIYAIFFIYMPHIVFQ